MIKRSGYQFAFIVPQELTREEQDEVLLRCDVDQEQAAFIVNGEKLEEELSFAAPQYVVFYECQPSVEVKFNKERVVFLTKNNPDERSVNTIKNAAMCDFPHLHLHDEFSLRDGIGTAKQRIEIMKQRGWTYLTASNHGSIGGWAKQYVFAKQNGLKPIFGVEAYVNEFRRYTAEDAKKFDEEMKLRFRKNNHFLLLARTVEGWFNIIKIHNDAQLNGFYYVPRTDDDFLHQHGKGIIATSCDGGAGKIPQILTDTSLSWEERLSQAKMKYDFYKSCFDDFYIELNLLDWPDQPEINRLLITFGEWVKAKYVITCDSHYLRPEDHKTHDILLMIRDGKTFVDKALSVAGGELSKILKQNNMCVDHKSEEWMTQKKTEKYDEIVKQAIAVGRCFLEQNGFNEAVLEYDKVAERIAKGEQNFDTGNEDSVWEFNVKDLYFKDFNDIYATWKKLHSNDPVFTEELFWRAVKNTHELVRSVDNFDVDTSVKLPKINENADDELRQVCRQGMHRLGLSDKSEYENRLEHELSVISKLGFSDYFLVFKKIVEFCAQKEIALGCGRGSAAGSLVSYCLDITQLDPLKYGLLFERFLEEGRSDPPDIDTDFDSRYRDVVKQGLIEMFGEQHVCSVGSYQLMKTKSTLKDVTRVFCIPVSEVNGITKRLSDAYADDDDVEEEVGIDKIDWDLLVKQEPLLQQFFTKYPYVESHCKALRGQIRNIGKHPAGIIVASVNLPEWVPVRRFQDEIVACWTEGLEMKELQSFGLVKYDVLGLRTVSIIADAFRLIGNTTVELTLENGKKVMISKDETVKIAYQDKLYDARVGDLQPGHVLSHLSERMIQLNDGTLMVSYENGYTPLSQLEKPLVITSVNKRTLKIIDLPVDDRASLKRLNELDVFGVFQFETPVATKVVREIGIDSLNDMYAATTLGRPDPLSGRLHEVYGRRKRKEETWEEIPCIADFMNEVFNLPLYQETTMLLARRLAGFSAAEANALRKGLAKGKDNEENMKKLKKLLTQFRERAQKSVDEGKIDQEKLDRLLNIIEEFGGYGFNKCLTPDTVVEKQDGSLCQLGEIKIGDVIRGMSSTGYVEVTDVIDSGKKEVVELTLSSGHTIKCTVDHKFLCEDGIIRPLLEILNSSHEIMVGMKSQKITNVRHIGIQPTMNITVNSDSHLFFANGGIVTSNSHAASYALMAYVTLFLKTHFPSQFICTLFNFTERSKEDKNGISQLARYVRYARKRGVAVLPPNVNKSERSFSLEGVNKIRWGVLEIKGLGDGVADDIATKRPFSSLNDLCDRVERRKLNKTKVLALIKSGACDDFGKREVLINDFLGIIRKEKDYEFTPFTEEQAELAELDLLGVTLSKTIMPSIEESWLEQYGIKRLIKLPESQRGVFIGRVKDIVERKSNKSGKNMLIVKMHDDEADAEFFVWEKDIACFKGVAKPGKIVTVPLKKFDDGGACFYSGPKEMLVDLSSAQ